MFFNTIKSEWTKLLSTASFWWTTSLVIVLSFGFTILSALLTEADSAEAMVLSPYTVSAPYIGFGIAIVLIQAIMVVTTEYRFGLASANFLGTPKRWPVMTAKFVMYGLFAAVLSLFVVVGSFLLTKMLLPEQLAEAFTPFESESGQRLLWVIPLVTVVAVMFVQGLGMLVRQTAGTVAITIIWLLGFDQLLRFIPQIGDDIAKAMPFHNMNLFLQNSPVESTEWSTWSSFGVFALWAAVAWVAGLVVTQRRDA